MTPETSIFLKRILFNTQQYDWRRNYKSNMANFHERQGCVGTIDTSLGLAYFLTLSYSVDDNSHAAFTKISNQVIAYDGRGGCNGVKLM